MKQGFLFILLSIFAISCGDDDKASPELIGTWRLIEVLADPGDGSGTFMPVASEKTVTFSENGIVVTNNSFCSLSDGAGTTGIYSLEDSVIVPSCPDIQITTNIWFKIESQNLILTYQCIEPCAEKYVKL